MNKVKIIIETISQEIPYSNEEVKIIRSLTFDKTILDTFNPASLLSRIILEEGIDSDTITSITYREV